MFGAVPELMFSGTGGVAHWTYYVLASASLNQSFTQWTRVATNNFDANGNFLFTNIAPMNSSQQFYLLELP
jgi:hypothetical protein